MHHSSVFLSFFFLWVGQTCVFFLIMCCCCSVRDLSDLEFFVCFVFEGLGLALFFLWTVHGSWTLFWCQRDSPSVLSFCQERILSVPSVGINDSCLCCSRQVFEFEHIPGARVSFSFHTDLFFFLQFFLLHSVFFCFVFFFRFCCLCLVEIYLVSNFIAVCFFELHISKIMLHYIWCTCTSHLFERFSFTEAYLLVHVLLLDTPPPHTPLSVNEDQQMGSGDS